MRDTEDGSCDYTPRTGGGLDGLAEGDLMATGEGFLHYARRDAQGGLRVSKLPYRVTLNEADLATSGESEYGRNTFRVTDILIEELGAEAILYATRWVPPIAVSSVIVLEKDRFPYWRGDMLIGSDAASLFPRTNQSGARRDSRTCTSAESAGRIRDLLEDRNGTVAVWFDDGPIAFLEPAESTPAATSQTASARGQALFAACAGCHALADGATQAIGPDLAGIVNRPIADSQDFSYSRALTQVPGR